MSKAQLAPFDPGNDFDAMAESFRRQVADMALKALDAAVFRDLPPERQIECFSMGVMTGLLGTVFAQIEPEGRKYFVSWLRKNLPQVVKQAEGCLGETPASRTEDPHTPAQ